MSGGRAYLNDWAAVFCGANKVRGTNRKEAVSQEGVSLIPTRCEGGCHGRASLSLIFDGCGSHYFIVLVIVRRSRGPAEICDDCPSFSLWEARAREEPGPKIKTRSSGSTKIWGLKELGYFATLGSPR